MEFPEAISKLEEMFGRLTPKVDFQPDETLHVASGGVLKRLIDEAPALTTEKGLAIEVWFQSVTRALRAEKFKRWSIIDGPHCDKWRITIQDERCTHRIAADRYSVICTIGLAGSPDDPEAQPAKD